MSNVIKCQSITNEATGKSSLHVYDDDGNFIVVSDTPEHRDMIKRQIDWQSGVGTEYTAEQLFSDLDPTADMPSKAERVTREVNKRLEKVSRHGHITTDGVHVFYDNETFSRIGIDPTLEDHLVRLMTSDDAEDKRAFECFAAFTENLYTNVDERIRKQLVSWMAAQQWLTFTEDGCFIGYKGCKLDSDGETPLSIHSGYGIVDGEVMNGYLPNRDGSVIEMPRNMVHKDPATGCSIGLHVGTYGYARGFADGVILKVKANPQDVVSVPFDCSAQKIRCCRYEVLEHETCSGWYDSDADDGDRYPTWYDDGGVDVDDIEDDDDEYGRHWYDDDYDDGDDSDEQQAPTDISHVYFYDDLYLPQELCHAFGEHGIETVGDLRGKTRSELLGLGGNVTERYVDELLDALDRYGYGSVIAPDTPSHDADGSCDRSSDADDAPASDASADDGNGDGDSDCMPVIEKVVKSFGVDQALAIFSDDTEFCRQLRAYCDAQRNVDDASDRTDTAATTMHRIMLDD